MRHFLLAATIVMAITACKQNESHPLTNEPNVVQGVETSTPISEKKTPAYLEQRVTSIYSKVFEEYNKTREMEEIGNIPDLDSLYCSKDWNNWVQKVNEYDSENNPDNIGFFEADYWVMGQDFDNLEVSDVKTISMNDKIAVVELNVHNMDDINRVRLDMVFEGDEWMIDDFSDWKKQMKEYVRGK